MKKSFKFLTVLALLFIVLSSGAVFAINPNLSIDKLIKQADAVFIVNKDPIPVIVANSDATQSATPVNWEYSTDCFSSWDTYSSGLPQRLNTRASDGWELTSTLQFQPQLACEYWKRPV